MNTETFQNQYPIALTAIAVHIQTFGLPAPLDIFVVDEIREGRMGKAIRLHLPGRHSHQAWVDSVDVDEEKVEPGGVGCSTRHEWFVRLPDTGIRLQLVGYRHNTMLASA